MATAFSVAATSQQYRSKPQPLFISAAKANAGIGEQTDDNAIEAFSSSSEASYQDYWSGFSLASAACPTPTPHTSFTNPLSYPCSSLPSGMNIRSCEDKCNRPNSNTTSAVVRGSGSYPRHSANKSISSSSGESCATGTTNSSPTTTVLTTPVDSPTATAEQTSSCVLDNLSASPSESRFFKLKQASASTPIPDGNGMREPSMVLSTNANSAVATHEKEERAPAAGCDTTSYRPTQANLSQTDDVQQDYEHSQQRERHQSASSERSAMSRSSSSSSSRNSSTSRKGRRNVKNLTLALPTSFANQDLPSPAIRPGSTATTAGSMNPCQNAWSSSLPLRRVSAPASPQRPAATQGLGQGVNARRGRRRPTNLTIQTPRWDSSVVAVSADGKGVPPTPGQMVGPHGSHGPHLHHIKSSPSLLPSYARLQKKPLNATSVAELPDEETMADETAIFSDSTSSDHGDPTVIPRTVFQTKEEGNVISHNGPPTRESQCTPRGYPDGPICIYDEGLYLYLEPEIEDVSSFDVIVNVAQEVPNPFSKVDVKKEEKVGSTKKPQEYVHVPWGHNSEILDDLYPLCRFIESRLSRSQRVLIHCQLGVSRSASLVIAYGLYKNPDKDFNEMYRIVKERSEWVGPNLGLIYQLVDFKGQVARGGDDSTGDLPHSWFERCEPTQETTGLKVQSVANPSLLAVPATDRPSESPLSPSAREPLSPSFIKTTFFADDDSVPKQRATSGPILSSPSKSSNTFADLLSQRRRSSFTPRPLPLREKFEKPQLDAKPPPTPTTATTATTNDNHKFPKLAPPPSFSVIARAEHKANMPPIAHVLKQDTSATLGSAFEMPEPRCSFGQTPNQRQQQQQEEKQTGQEAKILASPRTREFTQMQLPALSTIQARRASVKLASLQSGPVQPQLSRPKTATFPEAGMPLSDDPRSPPPRPSISAGGYRRRSKASDYAQQFQMDLQQHMQRIQSCKARAEPTVMMQSIDDVL